MTRAEFPNRVKAAAFARADGHCEECTAKLMTGNVEYDHRIPCALGGSNELDNCVVLCKTCHLAKTTKADVPRMAKAKRQRASHIGAKQRGWGKAYRNGREVYRGFGGMRYRDTGEPVR